MSEGKQLQAKGIRQYQSGEFEKAAATFQEAIAAFEKEQDEIGAAEQKVNLGLCYRSLEQYPKAAELIEAGLATFRSQADRGREAQALGNLALVYAKQDNLEQATTLYREAAALFRELKDDENYGQTILALADVQFKAGDYAQAAMTFEIGLDNIRNPNHRQKMAKQLLVVKNRLLGQKKGESVSQMADSEQPAEGNTRRRHLLRRKNSESKE